MQWKDAKVERPPEGIQVLTIDTRRGKEFAEYRLDYTVDIESEPNGYIWACRFQDEMDNVTHWMYLPELPQVCL